MKEFDVVQGSEAWHRLRLGIPTASRFSKILTPKTGKPSEQMTELICELLGERLCEMLPEHAESYMNNAMRHGTETEPLARERYEMLQSVTVRQIGFCKTDDERFGASPDGLVDPDGVVEIKCPQPKTHAKYILNPGALVGDYAPQIHGLLIVTGRQWCDIMSFCPLALPGFDPVIQRVEPNDYTDLLRRALDEFWSRFEVALEALAHRGKVVAS